MQWLDQVDHFYGDKTTDHDLQLLTFMQVVEADHTLIVEPMRLYRTQATAAGAKIDQLQIEVGHKSWLAAAAAAPPSAPGNRQLATRCSVLEGAAARSSTSSG